MPEGTDPRYNSNIVHKHLAKVLTDVVKQLPINQQTSFQMVWAVEGFINFNSFWLGISLEEGKAVPSSKAYSKWYKERVLEVPGNEGHGDQVDMNKQFVKIFENVQIRSNKNCFNCLVP